MGLGKFRQKKCDQLHVFSLWRLTWVFDGTWKKFSQKSVPSHTFLRCGDYLKFLRGLGKFRQKSVPSHRFLRCGDYLSFWWDLESFDKKVWSVTRFFAVQAISSFWWDLEKFSQKKCAQLHVLFAVETNLSFWCDLKSLDKKVWPVTHFFRSADCLQLLMGLRKISTKMCAQLHVFFCCGDFSCFWWDLESFDKKVWPVTRFVRCRD